MYGNMNEAESLSTHCEVPSQMKEQHVNSKKEKF